MNGTTRSGTGIAAEDAPPVADCARLVVDGRGVMRRFPGRARVAGRSGQEQSAVQAPQTENA